MPPGTRYFLEVNPRIPKRLARLQELAHNLWYSWDRPTRALFAKLNPPLWDAVGHSPKALLKRIDEQRLIDAATDPAFLDSLTRVLAAFDAYHAEPPFRQNSGAVQREDLVAYFCAEFGIHESLPIYSGGLGILAGDHCKAASDFQLPFVAVGLMYRQGYFTQTIDGDGRQRAAYYDSDFEDLPIEAVKRKDGTELSVELAFPARKLLVKVWQARVGHVSLYLLDTDLPENAERERDIVHRLYGGDRTTRLEQEIVLGVGGMRALAALGFEPTVWHINEGHAAFLVLERVRALVAGGLALEAAIEAVASNTVFTTHTPVPAGHDQFTDATVVPYVKSLFGELGAPDKVAAPALGRRLQHDGARDPRLAAPQRRVAHSRRRVAGPAQGLLAAGLAGRKPGGLHHERGARAHVPRAGMGRSVRPVPRRGLDAPPGLSGHLGKDPRHSRPHLLERAPGHQGADAAHGAPPAADPAHAQPRQRVAPRAAAALRRSGQAARAHDRLRQALRHLQARHPALHRHGTPAADRVRPRAPGAVPFLR